MLGLIGLAINVLILLLLLRGLDYFPFWLILCSNKGRILLSFGKLPRRTGLPIKTGKTNIYALGQIEGELQNKNSSIFSLYLISGSAWFRFKKGPIPILPLFWGIVEDITEEYLLKTEQQKELDNTHWDLEKASVIQTFTLPPWIVLSDSYIFSRYYNPSLSVGGDLLEYISMDGGNSLLLLGDITGEGLQAALLMMGVKSIIPQLLNQLNCGEDLGDFFNQLRLILERNLFKEHYMTLFLAYIDRSKELIYYINAGHPEPYLISVSKKTKRLKAKEIYLPIGWGKGVPDIPRVNTIPFSPGETLFCFTDGLTEALSPEGKLMGEKKLSYIIKDIEEIDPYTLPFNVAQEVYNRGYETSGDDTSMIALHFISELERTLHPFPFWEGAFRIGDFIKTMEAFFESNSIVLEVREEMFKWIKTCINREDEQRAGKKSRVILCLVKLIENEASIRILSTDPDWVPANQEEWISQDGLKIVEKHWSLLGPA